MKRSPLLVVLFSVLFCVAIITSGCGTDISSSDEFPRDLTSSEAQIFARTLNNNFLSKNTEFSAEPMDENEVFKMAGSIDWENKTALVRVATNGQQEPDLESIVGPEEVLETFTGLEKLLGENDIEKRKWISRVEVTDIYKSDTIARFLLELISDTPENPQLVRQDGTKMLGNIKINNEELLVFEKSGNIRYFVNQESELRRIRLTLTGFSGAIAINFFNYGQATVAKPDSDNVHSLSTVSDIFASNRPNF